MSGSNGIRGEEGKNDIGRGTFLLDSVKIFREEEEEERATLKSDWILGDLHHDSDDRVSYHVVNGAKMESGLVGPRD